MLSTRTSTFFACAAIIGLTGCSSLAPASSDADAKAAVEASATASSGDPILDSLPEAPWDVDLQDIMVQAEKKLDADQDGLSPTDLTDAIRTVIQVDWVADQRETMFRGNTVEVARASIRDIERFVAPSAMDSYLPDAQKVLAHMEAEEAGNAPELADGERYPYKLYPGIAAAGSTVATPEDDAAYPDYASKDGEPGAIWLSIYHDDATTESVPVLKGARATRSKPMIDSITDAPAVNDPTHAVLITHPDFLEVPLAGDRTARVYIERTTQVGLEDGKWLVQDSTWNVVSIMEPEPGDSLFSS